MTRDNRLYIAWVIALIATIGSLYFSEIQNFKPCILCWYQRIAMYPLVLILGIAAFTRDLKIRRYALSLAVIGFIIALIQNLEVWGLIKEIKGCNTDPSASCGIPWPIWGTSDGAKKLAEVLSIPMLSMISFGLISALLSWPKAQATAPSTTTQTSDSNDNIAKA